jgi:hypothetical protein
MTVTRPDGMDAGLPRGVAVRLRWRPSMLAAVETTGATARQRAGIGRVSTAAVALHAALARRWQPGRPAIPAPPAGPVAAVVELRPAEPPGPATPSREPGASAPGPSGPVGVEAPAHGPATARQGLAPSAPEPPLPRPVGPPAPEQPPSPRRATAPDPQPTGELRRSPLRLVSLREGVDGGPDGPLLPPPARHRDPDLPPPGLPAAPHPAPTRPPATPAGAPSVAPTAASEPADSAERDEDGGRLFESVSRPLVLPGLELRPAAAPAGPTARPPRPPAPTQAGPAQPPGSDQAPGDGHSRPSPAGPSDGPPAVDLNAVVEQVIQRLARHHRMEQDRRGWS